jgi:AraC-like DNA-binding protein
MATVRQAQVNSVTNIVENVILADSTFTMAGYLLVTSNTAAKGDVYDPAHASFSTPTVVEPVPATVTRVQLRLRLNQLGLLDTIDSWVTANGDAEAKIRWFEMSSADRASPTLTTMAAAFGMSNSTLDQIFRDSAKIT